MEITSKLVWTSADTPEELAPMLRTLAEEFPVSDGGRGLKLNSKESKLMKQSAGSSVQKAE